MPKLLIIDDDPAIPLLVRGALGAAAVEYLTAASASAGLEAAIRERPDAIVLDVMLPDRTGLNALGELRQRDPKTPVVVITSRGTSDNAIEAMRLGALDFLVKPLELPEVRRVLERAFEVRRLMHAPVGVRDERSVNAGIFVGRSSCMQQVYKAIGRAAGLETPVLIFGETGSGKELVAQAIHQHSNRRHEPFVVAPCAAESEFQIEALIFGDETTPASLRRPPRNLARQPMTSGALPPGLVAQAARGTLFLDEVAALPLSTQSRLLRLIEAQSAEATGSGQPGSQPLGPPAVRVVAATQHDLQAMAAAGRFRSDLYYHLSGCPVGVPPLRQRLEDLPALADHLVQRLGAALGKRVQRVAPEAITRLEQHAWPGNVRELASVLKQGILRASGPVLLADFLPSPFGAPSAPDRPATAEPSGSLTTDWESFVTTRLEAGSEDLYAAAVAEMERQVLSLVLKSTMGNQAKAAKRLGITRGNLRAKIRGLGLVIERQVDVREPGEAVDDVVELETGP